MDSFYYIGSDSAKVTKFKKFKLKDQLPMDSNKDTSQDGKGCGCCKRFQEVVLGGLERFFYNYGKFVSR